MKKPNISGQHNPLVHSPRHAIKLFLLQRGPEALFPELFQPRINPADLRSLLVDSTTPGCDMRTGEIEEDEEMLAVPRYSSTPRFIKVDDILFG